MCNASCVYMYHAVHICATLLHMSCMTFPTLSVDTEVGETIVCKSKLCKTATQGREHQMRLQAYAKVHDTKLETSKEVENRWNYDVYIYAMCTSQCLHVHCAHYMQCALSIAHRQCLSRKVCR